MVWTGITIGGRTQLISIYGNLNATSYCDNILQLVVFLFAKEMGKNFLFTQDNARSHAAKVVREFLANNKIKVLLWPAQFSYLNSIEHL